MSLRQVLTIYNAERQLNEDDTALLNTLRRFTEPERALLIEQLSDKPQKKPGKGRAGKGAGKSARASGMQAQLSNRRQEQVIKDGACAYVLENGTVCNTGDNNPIHDETFGYAGYHPFVSPQQAEAASGD